MKRPIGSSVCQWTSSRTTGASARAGATTTSYWSIQLTRPRAKICSWAEARWVSSADMPRTSSHSAQLSGSISCSSGSRPCTSRPKAIWSVTSGAKSAVKACSSVSSRHGASRLLDVVAERLEQAPGLARRLDARWVERHVDRRVGDHRHAQAAPARAPRRRRRPRPAAAPTTRRRSPCRPAGRAPARCRATVVREHAVDGQEALAGLGRQRDAVALGLEADEAAARGRDARRAAAVVGVGDRHHAGRDGASPSRPTSRRSCAPDPTGCASARSAWCWSTAGCPTRAGWSIRRRRSPPP